MKKINIFLPPVIITDEQGNEFVDENFFITEIEYPFNINWFADDMEFVQYLFLHKQYILNKTPSWYSGGIYSASLRDTKNHKTRQFYFILHED